MAIERKGKWFADKERMDREQANTLRDTIERESTLRDIRVVSVGNGARWQLVIPNPGARVWKDDLMANEALIHIYGPQHWRYLKEQKLRKIITLTAKGEVGE